MTFEEILFSAKRSSGGNVLSPEAQAKTFGDACRTIFSTPAKEISRDGKAIGTFDEPTGTVTTADELAPEDKVEQVRVAGVQAQAQQIQHEQEVNEADAASKLAKAGMR